MDDHKARVRSISKIVSSFHARQQPFRIYHGSTSTTRKTQLSRSNVVDTSKLDHVICVDSEKKTIAVEPNISMEHLVDATLEHGLLPPVVMEFPAITVGGGFAGTAGESSTFKYGLFDRTISKIEIVLADGEVVSASAAERPDLFKASAGTFGTFGVITLLEIPLIPAEPFVRLTYTPVIGIAGALSSIERRAEQSEIDYIEGIMFGKDRGVIISGKLTRTRDPALRCTSYARSKDPWFYLRAEEIVKQHGGKAAEEIVPIKDYLFRYDRGAFWAGMYGFKYFKMPFNSLTRRALDPLMHTKTMYHAMHTSGVAHKYVVQDIGFPHSTVEQFTDYLHDRLGFYPLWLCPMKMEEDMSLRPRDQESYMSDSRSPGRLLNVGLWGPGAERYDDFVAINRDIEHKTSELGGFKCLYAQAFYTEDEFWRIYDKEWYDAVRSKYKASSLPSVYEKVNAALLRWKPESEQSWRQRAWKRLRTQRPLDGAYGVLHVLLKRDYLLSK